MAHLKHDPTRDAELVAGLQAGDRSALSGLYRIHKDKVYSIALYFFHGDAALAADITQQVFLKLMTDVRSYRGEAGFSTWLYRLVVNACIDLARSRRQRSKREGPALDNDSPRLVNQGPTPAEEYERQQKASAVRTAVGSLPEPFRIAVLLRHFEQLSYEEMAQALDCSLGTVASRLSRAHRLLARSLGRFRPCGK